MENAEALSNPEPTRHGYWGPVLGESVELYERLGAPFLHVFIRERMPRLLHSEFDMAAGRTVDKGPLTPEEATAAQSLTRQERLEKVVEFTKYSEVMHEVTLIGASAIAMTSEALAKGNADWLDVTVFTAFEAANIVFNVSTIIVQRYNRMRAYRLLDILGRRAINNKPDYSQAKTEGAG